MKINTQNPTVKIEPLSEVLNGKTSFRYEYQTMQFPLRFPLRPGFDSHLGEPSAKHGWMRVWADIDVTGVFAIYRRELKKEPARKPKQKKFKVDPAFLAMDENFWDISASA